VDEPGWRAELRADLTGMARSHRDLAVAVAEASVVGGVRLTAAQE
jgi:hypothetical protein